MSRLISNLLLVALVACASAVAGGPVRPPLYPVPIADVSNFPVNPAVGDLNEDGHPDLVVTGEGTQTVAVLLSDRTGGFLAESFVDTPANPGVTLALADLNDDGHLDLVYGNLFVHLGRGDATFEPYDEYSVPTGTASIAVADVDEDGKPDLLVCNNGAVWLPNVGGGQFGPAQALPPGFGDGAIAVGDFDGDGHVDVASAGEVVLGGGDGTFGEILPIGFGEPFVVGDFDSDGLDDLAAVAANDQVWIWLAEGEGVFGAGPNLVPDGVPRFFAVDDFDGDGRDDLATAYSVTSARFITVWEGILDPGGARTTVIDTGGGELGLVTADFNLDGRPDLGVSIYNAWAGVILRTASGAFDFARRHEVGAAPRAIQAVDVDADGKVDLVVANRDSRDVSILPGRGDGTFDARVSFGAGTAPHSVVAADLEPDGDLDLLVTDEDGAAVSVLLGVGDGSFLVGGSVPVGAEPGGLASGLLNDDAVVDIAVANRGGEEVSLLFGDGLGGFAPAVNVPVGPSPQDVLIADLDHDGAAELIVAVGGENAVKVLPGDGFGGFGTPVSFPLLSDPRRLAAGDLDGNGELDLAVWHGYSVSTLLGHGDGTFADAVRYSPFLRAPGGLRIADIDGNGVQDVVVVHFPWLVRVLGGRGDGTLEELGAFASAYSPQGVAIDDFDRDGRPDVATSGSPVEDAVALSLNRLGVPQLRLDGDGSLTWDAFWGAQEYRLFGGDLADLVDGDVDGLPDAGYGDCLGTVGETTFADPMADPSSGAGRFYLLEAVGLTGPAGGLGTTSDGLARVAATGCPEE